MHGRVTMLENDPQKAAKKSTAKHCLNARRRAGSNRDVEPGHISRMIRTESNLGGGESA
jgi:hypothetical protein